LTVLRVREVDERNRVIYGRFEIAGAAQLAPSCARTLGRS